MTVVGGGRAGVVALRDGGCFRGRAPVVSQGAGNTVFRGFSRKKRSWKKGCHPLAALQKRMGTPNLTPDVFPPSLERVRVMTRRTSWGLLALVLAWCAAAPGAWAALRPIQGAVAVGDLRVDIDNQWVDYRKLTPEAMEESLTRLGQFSNVVGHARMSAKLPAVPTQAELMTAARELKADFVVSSTLKNLLENEEKGQLFIELETDLFEVATGERVGTSLVRGASSPKPGFAGGKNVLVQEAVYNAAEHAVAEIRSSTAMQGTVSIVQNAEQVFVTLAEVNTVAPGAYIGIYGDKGNKLGLVEVGDAGIAQASGKLVQRKPGMLIRQGQSARVEYVPSPTFQEFLTVVEQTKPRKKKGGSSMLIGLLGVGAVAVLLGVGQNKKDAATTEKAKIAGKIGCSNCPPGETASVTIPSSANNVVLPTIKTTTTFPSLPNNGFLNQASSVFDFKPDGLQFNSAVTLAIGFQDADKNFCVDGKTDPTDTSNTDGDPIGCVNTNKLQLYTYDPNRQEWVLVEGSSVTTTGSDTRVSASVQHFSLYVILENEAPAPPQPPQAVSVNCTSPTDVKLVWNPSTSTDVAFYNIYECTSLGGGCGTTPLVGGIGVTTQDVGDLATNQIRYFSVSAVDSLGQEGTKSGIVAAQQCKVVPTPSLISPTGNERVNTKTPTLTFKGSVDNEEGYFLEVINRSPNPANAAQEIVTLMWQVRVCNSGSIISSGGCSSGTTPGTGEQSTSGSVSTPITISLTYGGAALVTGTSYEWRVCSLDLGRAAQLDALWQVQRGGHRRVHGGRSGQFPGAPTGGAREQ